MDYELLLNAIMTGLPPAIAGISTLVHIFTDKETGQTAVTILETGKASAANTHNLVKAWNNTHPVPASTGVAAVAPAAQVLAPAEGSGI